MIFSPGGVRRGQSDRHGAAEEGRTDAGAGGSAHMDDGRGRPAGQGE